MSLHPARLLAPAALALAVLAPLGVSSAADAAHAAPSARTTQIEPATLARGADPAVPQLLGRTIIDGDLRIKVPGREVQLYGASGPDYVVGVWTHDGGSRIQRVSADGSRQTVVDRIRGDVVLSGNGRQIVETIIHSNATTVATVRNAVTGDRLARRTLAGYLRALDADRGVAVLGGSSPARTVRWRLGADTISRIVGREGYFADIRADRVATLTDNPYEGGCSVVTSLSAPRTTLWRSCDRAVLTVAPNGHRMLTTYLLTDGPIGEVSVQGRRGHRIATYRTSGTFGLNTWETNRSVLITTYGSEKAAIVRCQVNACERASRRVASHGI